MNDWCVEYGFLNLSIYLVLLKWKEQQHFYLSTYYWSFIKQLWEFSQVYWTFNSFLRIQKSTKVKTLCKTKYYFYEWLSYSSRVNILQRSLRKNCIKGLKIIYQIYPNIKLLNKFKNVQMHEEMIFNCCRMDIMLK